MKTELDTMKSPTNGNTALQNILFISLPEDTERTIGNFTIDSSHLIPVEVPPGKQEWDITDLSWEMIISAMLKIFAYNPEHEDIEYYRSFIRAVQPNLVAELTRTAIIKAEEKEYDIAEEIFLALNHYAPEEYTTFINLALLYEDQAVKLKDTPSSRYDELFEKAFSVYQRGLERYPDSAEMHIHAGYFFLKVENHSSAAEHLELFLGLAPEDERNEEVTEILAQISLRSNDDSIFTEAFDLIKLNREDEAIEKIDTYLSRNPEVWNAWFIRGWANRKLANYAEASDALQKCLALGAVNIDIYNELAICTMELGQFTDSVQFLRKALELEPENVKIISNFGVLEMKRGNAEEALRFFQVAHALDPDDPVSQEYIRILSGHNG